jgi:hypothetical protein
VQYLAGYLWRIKPRNADEFQSMAEKAGAANSDDGVGLAGVRLTPIKNLRLDVSNQYGVNTFNTIYAEADYLQGLAEDWKLRLGAQFTDQRAVGEALLAPADGRYWATQQGGARVQLSWRELTVTTAFSITGAGNTIQAPWGSFPGYLSMIDQDFDRAREKAILLGAAYVVPGALVQGVSATANIVWGWDAINPTTRQKAPNQTEYDLTVDWRPAWKNQPGFLRGMWFRARSALLDQQNAPALGYQFRLILNWERDLI